MHSANLAVFVQLQDVSRGRFKLAPAYDMLPMRWRPDAKTGNVEKYSPFAPDAGALSSDAAPMELEFWRALAGLDTVTSQLRSVARQMTAAIERAG